MRIAIAAFFTAAAAGVVAYSDSYSGHRDPYEHIEGHLSAREAEAEADAEAVAAWQAAHGGSLPIYKSQFGQSEEYKGHLSAREAEAEADAEAIAAWQAAHGGSLPSYVSQVGQSEGYNGHVHAREAGLDVPDFGGEHVDTSLDGYDHILQARDITFDEQDVDTSLSGYGRSLLDARDLPSDEEDVDYSLEGYDHYLLARDRDDVDTSLEGYDHSLLGARDLSDEVDYSLEGYDHHLLVRDITFDEDDVDTSLEGYDHSSLHARDLPFDEEDVDTSLSGYDHQLLAREINFNEEDVDTSLEGYGEPYVERRDDAGVELGDGDPKLIDVVDGTNIASPTRRSVPDFGGEEVDTSLEGYGAPYIERRDDAGVEPDDGDPKLIDVVDGANIATPSRRSAPVFDEEDVDVSLAGYDHDLLYSRDISIGDDEEEEAEEDNADDEDSLGSLLRRGLSWAGFTKAADKASKTDIHEHAQQHHARAPEADPNDRYPPHAPTEAEERRPTATGGWGLAW